MIKTQAIAKFNPNETLTIWDVRDADSYQAGHIAHAINVPIEHINAQTLAQITGDIYILCGGGTKAGRACELLETLDPNRTYVHLIGGTREAEALGWTLTKS
ncbi:rhodanese-like domain-containing protein [Moraxella nonliquefaciens]|jgi:hypothetical protein|uniref:rhodanese-like domain-containing protein n=1 Tax=Moraxella nonliquefaciens TaxID=478 RepID=UPI00081DF079|nr:rhodanese-like domain-containing protein [Moraxella nonliquefaciens]OBX50098.1 sulfurtransferase [Moraxella nonliquefaciens]